MHASHLSSKECLQQTNYWDHQKKFQTELTSSTPMKSINLELIAWLSLLKTTNVKSLIVTDYKASDVVEWVFKNFETFNSNAVTLQDMESQSCGQYALMYLKMKARGKSMHDFISLFKKGNYVYNDHLVGEMVKPLLDGELGILNVVNKTISDVVVWIYK